MPKENYQVGDIVDLDDVVISPAAYQAWQATAAVSAQALIVARIVSDPSQIPIEQGLWLASGELEIFVEIVVGQQPALRISMKIPSDQWTWT